MGVSTHGGSKVTVHSLRSLAPAGLGAVRTFALGILLAASWLATGATAASVIYTYTGNNFTSVASPYTTGNSISGYFTVSAPLASSTEVDGLAVDSYWFTDGVQTLTSSDAGETALFDILTDASGNIKDWLVQFDRGNQELITTTSTVVQPLDGGALDKTGTISYNTNDPGTWASAEAPEPASWLLMIGALFATASVVRTSASGPASCRVPGERQFPSAR